MRLLDGRPPWWLCWREGQELSGWRRLRFPPRGAAAGLVCAVLTLPSALTASCTPPALPPRVSSWWLDQWDLASRTGLGCWGFRSLVASFQSPAWRSRVQTVDPRLCAAGWGVGPVLQPRMKVGAQGAFFLPRNGRKWEVGR